MSISCWTLDVNGTTALTRTGKPVALLLRELTLPICLQGQDLMLFLVSVAGFEPAISGPPDQHSRPD